MQTIDIGTFCRELLHNVFSDLGNKAGDLGVEAIPGVDVTVAEAEAGGEREEAKIVLAGLPGHHYHHHYHYHHHKHHMASWCSLADK